MNLFKLLFLTLFLFTAALTQAQSPASENTAAAIQSNTQNNNYALLIRNFNHVKAAVKTVDMLTENDPNAVNKFEVIICGRQIANINDHKKLIETTRSKRITLTACGMSMNKFSISQENLPDGVEVVPNGLIRIFELQDEGYQTITL